MVKSTMEPVPCISKFCEVTKISNFTTTRRLLEPWHDYLGMMFDYSFTREVVSINMWDYLGKVIKEFPEEITGTRATPACDHLFKVREDRRKLMKS